MKDLFSVLPGISKHRFLGLLIAILLGIGGSIAVWLMPSKYEASARAYVDSQSILGPLLEGMTVQPNVEQQFVMMSRALLSRPNLEKVAEKAGLLEKLTNEQDRREAVTQLGSDVRFEPEGRGDFFSIAYRNKAPKTALTVISSLLDLFIEATRGDQKRDTEQATQFLGGQLSVYEERLRKAERALKDFKLANIDVLPEGADYLAQSAATQKEYELARLQLRQATNSTQAIRNQLQGVPRSLPSPQAEQIKAAAATPTEARLIAARKRLDELSSRYTKLHPDMISINRSINNLEALVSRERLSMPKNVSLTGSGAGMVQNKLYADLSVALTRGEAQIASLRAAVSDSRRRALEMKELAKKVPKVEAEYAQLNRDYEVNKLNYEKLLARRDSASLSRQVEENIGAGAGAFRLVDPPSVGKGPIWPNRPLFLVLVLLASIAAGIAAAALRHLSAPTFFSLNSLRDRTGLPVAGEIGVLPGTNQAGRVMSSLLFWLSSAVFLGVFALMIAWAMYGHTVKPEQVPQFMKPLLDGKMKPAKAVNLNQSNQISKGRV